MSISNQAGSLTIFPLTGTLSNPMKGISLASTSPATLVFTDTGIPFDPRITFTRSTVGNRFNSSGVLASTAIDVARANANQDYNPSTLAARGFLIEAGATNLLLYSQQFGETLGWTLGGSTVTADAINAPDGTLSADKLVEDTSTGAHSVTGTQSVVSGTQYCFSIYAKKAERKYLNLGGMGFTGQGFVAVFDLDAGAIHTNTGGRAVMEPVGSGWYRCSIFVTASNTSSVFFSMLNDSASGSYTGNGTSGLYVWGAQLEANAFATSYIATGASATARGSDLPSVDDLPGIGYNSTQGSLSGEVMFEGVGSSSTRRIASFNDGTTDNEIVIVMADGGSDLIRFLVTSGGVTQADISSTVTAVANTLYKWCISWNANSFRISVNATAGTEDTSGTVPTVDRLTIGTDGAGANSVNGWEPTITYYPVQLSQAQMNSITA